MSVEYFGLNLALGIGIALDAMVLTLARFRSFRGPRSVFLWATATGLTHWLFPMFGFVLGWYAVAWSGLPLVIYALGGSAMVWLAWRVVREALEAPQGGAAEAPGFGGRVEFAVALWSVSVDAIVVGPGKSAAAARWSAAELWLSFALVGLVVFICVYAAAWMALRLMRSQTAGEGSLVRAHLGGTYFSVLVFSWFGLLSFRECAGLLGQPLPMGAVHAGAFCTLALLAFLRAPVLRQRARERARLDLKRLD